MGIARAFPQPLVELSLLLRLMVQGKKALFLAFSWPENRLESASSRGGEGALATGCWKAAGPCLSSGHVLSAEDGGWKSLPLRGWAECGEGLARSSYQNRTPEESQIPAGGFSCPERIILSAQVFIGTTDTSTVSGLPGWVSPNSRLSSPSAFSASGSPVVSCRVSPRLLSETEIVTLYPASCDACVPSWLPVETRGCQEGRGGRKREREKREVGRDPLWGYCSRRLWVNRKVT